MQIKKFEYFICENDYSYIGMEGSHSVCVHVQSQNSFIACIGHIHQSQHKQRHEPNKKEGE